MSDSIDDLYLRWQKNPDAARTTALCDALRTSARLDLVEIVGAFAAGLKDVSTLVAAGRMYSDVGRLEDAQGVLVTAGQLAPRDGEVFRWLGEVLLRRGDAERAERILERAVQFAGTDPEAGQWLSRARKLIPTQRAGGVTSVAAEVAASSKDPATIVSSRALSPKAPVVAPATVRAHRGTLMGGFPAEEPSTLIRTDAKHAPVAPIAPVAHPPAPAPRPIKSAPIQTKSIGLSNGNEAIVAATDQGSKPEFFGSVRAIVAASSAGWTPSGEKVEPIYEPSAASVEVSMPEASVPDAPVPAAPVHAVPVLDARIDPAQAPSREDEKTRIPEARDVLDALELVGVFEPDGAVKPTPARWDKPERGRLRIKSFGALVALALLSIGAGFGTIHYVKDRRAKEHRIAEDLLTRVDQNLLLSDGTLLDSSEKTLSRVFELDSRSPHAALTWLHERVARGLLQGGEDVAFQEAIVRAQEVGVPEKNVAFAQVATFLFQGDTAGATLAVAKWNEAAHDDPWFELLAGATLERAGDPQASEHYRTALSLAPNLFVAQVLLVRSTALEGDPAKALALEEQLRANSPDRAEATALRALVWSRSSPRGAPPADVAALSKDVALPVVLKAVPLCLPVLLASEKKDDPNAAKTAATNLERALAFADTPGLATWIGTLALDADLPTSLPLARRAALTALSMSPTYAQARVLAARVALAEGRLDDAAKAAEELPLSSPDVATIHASIAYEKLDLDRMNQVFDALGEDASKTAAMGALARGRSLLKGEKSALSPRKSGDGPWAEIIAMDAALDAGDLDRAKTIADTWTRPNALQSVRLARLARYQGALDDAEARSRAGLEGATVTFRSLTERVFTLVAREKSQEALGLLRTYPSVGGPVAKWLRAYVLASSGKVDDARAAVTQEEAPESAAPLPLRVVAAMAYDAMKDVKRGKPYIAAITKAGYASLDLQASAKAAAHSAKRDGEKPPRRQDRQKKTP